MKAQKAKMKGNEGPKGQNKFRRPSQTLIEVPGLVWAMGSQHEAKTKRFQNYDPPLQRNFGNFHLQESKKKASERPKGQNERK